MLFVDQARIQVKAGDGGQGCESFQRGKHMRYPRRDGGDGGRGGDIVFRADRNIHTLLDFKFKQHYKARSGGHGSGKGKKGRQGEDCVLRVPVGTVLKDHGTGLTLKDLASDQQSVAAAKGGCGGRGNIHSKIPTPPEAGEERIVDLELKLIADVGIVGFPNAGKSTLISNLAKVKSKIAAYPFTTRQPILGIVECEDDMHFAVADLPGIIEGAHKGKGLGIRFLKHAERTKILLHVIDMAGSEGRDPWADYEKLNHELQEYSDLLLFKHRIIAANKMDLPEAAGHLKKFRKKTKDKVIPISALERKGLKQLLTSIREIL